ncbi:MAG: hypothetical protein EPO13_10475 [Actinomycetota bacterium]|nr:MAG: hypothetical protein EPO13_10475 [Actinomycetota bacterium]
MKNRTRFAWATWTVAVVIALAGCGSSGTGEQVASVATGPSSTTSASPGTTGNLTAAEQGLKFAQCMREHGIDMADPEVGSDGRLKITLNGKPGQNLDAAQAACKDLLPTQPDGGGPGPAQDENMLKMAQCMRENGVAAFPDPQSGGGILDETVMKDPDFEAARDKCEKLYLPNGARRAAS